MHVNRLTIFFSRTRLPVYFIKKGKQNKQQLSRQAARIGKFSLTETSNRTDTGIADTSQKHSATSDENTRQQKKRPRTQRSPRTRRRSTRRSPPTPASQPAGPWTWSCQRYMNYAPSRATTRPGGRWNRIPFEAMWAQNTGHPSTRSTEESEQKATTAPNRKGEASETRIPL